MNPIFDISVIIPANNEEAWIGPCLEAVLAQDAAAGRVEVIVSANACRDRTVSLAEDFLAAFRERGWDLVVLDSPEPGKIGALNRADAAARSGLRAYLDADVLCDPALLGQVRQALEGPQATYATGTLVVKPAASGLTRAYAGFWQRLPFVKGGAVGAGFFAVNAAGRARWGDFPDIISDDTFVRLSFAPGERREVAARYHWPMVEGWANLVRVRRRQDAGVAEVYRLYPQLRQNEGKAAISRADLLKLALRSPRGFAVYAGVSLAVRQQRAGPEWSRGR